ncbi:MAG: apolipoprotein N-acyltransferase [Maricaulaceae bacterium]
MSAANEPYVDSVATWGLGTRKGRAYEFVLGALGALGFAPFYLSPITLTVLALFGLRLYRLHQNGGGFKLGFKTGWFFAFGFFLAGLFWIGSAFTMRPGGYIYLMVPMVGGLIAVLSLFWAVAAGLLLRRRAKAPMWVFALRFACLLFIAEFARGHVLGGLPWNLPGYIIEAGHPLSQVSSVIGIYGQSLLVLFLVALVMIGLSGPFLRPKMIGLGSASALVIGLWGYGSMRLPDKPIEYYPDVNLRLVVVDFSQRDQFDSNKNIEIVREFLRQSVSSGFEDVTHVVWPEGAISGLVIENQPLLNAVGQTFVSTTPNKPPVWVFNSLRREQATRVDGRVKDLYFNTMAEVNFDDSGAPRLAGFNDKTRLVPFGEFIPFADKLEAIGLGTLSAAIGSMTPGEEKTTFNITGLPEVNSLICYEGIFPDVSRPLAREAKWILNLSNDGWYGRLTGPAQHANQTRYRAIESGLPLVRSSAGGETGVYDSYGRTIYSSNSRVSRAIDVKIPRQLAKNDQLLQNRRFILLITIFILVLLGHVVERKTS